MGVDVLLKNTVLIWKGQSGRKTWRHEGNRQTMIGPLPFRSLAAEQRLCH